MIKECPSVCSQYSNGSTFNSKAPLHEYTKKFAGLYPSDAGQAPAAFLMMTGVQYLSFAPGLVFLLPRSVFKWPLL